MGLQITQLSQADKIFKQFLSDPSVPKAEKLSSLGQILKEMKVSETTSALFGELPLYVLCPFPGMHCIMLMRNGHVREGAFLS